MQPLSGLHDSLQARPWLIDIHLRLLQQYHSIQTLTLTCTADAGSRLLPSGQHHTS